MVGDYFQPDDYIVSFCDDLVHPNAKVQLCVQLAIQKVLSARW